MEQHSVFGIIRNFLFSKTYREFLFFLFFLILSGAFWLMTTLNETFEQELKVPVRIVSIPKNVMLTSDDTDTLRFTVRDKGYVLMSYYTKGIHPLLLPFKNYVSDASNSMLTVSNADLQKLVRQQLSASTTLLGVKADKMVFYYNYGSSKRVPVRWSGRVIPEHLYYISSVAYSNDSITIYAPKEKLDSINVVYTEALNCVNFRDTLTIDCQLRKTEGVKTTPSQVRVTFFTDVLTEESIDGIPVIGINLPKGKTLRTFPAKVKVSFVTGVNTFRSLTPADFTVVADYNEIQRTHSDKCNIYLRKVPHDISRASLNVKEVDYLIEESPKNE